VNKKLIQILKDNSFDIVQLEMLYMAPYIETIKQHSNARVILRAHNIEHLIWERITSVTKNPLKKWYIGNLTKKLKNYELSVMDKFDGIATITAKDAEFFRDAGCRIPLTDIPFGIEIGKYEPKYSKEKEISLFHLGSMNWMPNEEGVRWFLDKVWPLIHKKSPKLKFYLAGRMMPDWLTNLKIKNVEVVGEVDDDNAWAVGGVEGHAGLFGHGRRRAAPLRTTAPRRHHRGPSQRTDARPIMHRRQHPNQLHVREYTRGDTS